MQRVLGALIIGSGLTAPCAAQDVALTPAVRRMIAERVTRTDVRRIPIEVIKAEPVVEASIAAMSNGGGFGGAEHVYCVDIRREHQTYAAAALPSYDHRYKVYVQPGTGGAAVRVMWRQYTSGKGSPAGNTCLMDGAAPFPELIAWQRAVEAGAARH